MKKVEQLIQRMKEIDKGFLEIRKAADELISEEPADQSLPIAKELYRSQYYQARSLATFLFGRLSSKSSESLKFMKQQISQDHDWRVQEILAMAFDRYCSDTGYEKAIPTIKEWLSDGSQNVRRAVTEGLRIWTGRPYFHEHPEIAIQFLSRLRNDESEYVRKSVGNALRDISKKNKELVKKELKGWDLSNKQIAQTYKLASKFIKKDD
jgi:3-methyladenine DNA glycosylase AlkC